MKKTINYFILRAVSAIVLGMLLILCSQNVISFVVITIGILFMVPGLLAFISYFVSDKAQRPDVSVLLAGIGSLLFGVVLIVIPHSFVNILMYLLGIILLLGSIEQIVMLIRAQKRTTVSIAFYVVPLLILGAGILVLFNPFETAKTIFIIIGVTCLIYGITEFIYWLKFKRNYNKEVG